MRRHQLPAGALLALVLLAALRHGSAITCYQCNSEFDPRCGDPFDSYSLGTVNCSLQPRREHLPDLEPVLCRKTTQTVEGKIRVVRACGFVEDEKADDKQCIMRTGTKDVRSIYCSCTSDLCNGAESASSVSFGLVVLLTLGLLFLGGVPRTP